jgi:hypothetical protein
VFPCKTIRRDFKSCAIRQGGDFRPDLPVICSRVDREEKTTPGDPAAGREEHRNAYVRSMERVCPPRSPDLSSGSGED